MRGLLGEQPPFSKVREQDGQHEQEKGTSRDRDNGTRRGDRGERRVEEERPTREERERGALEGWLGPSLKINLKQDKR